MWWIWSHDVITMVFCTRLMSTSKQNVVYVNVVLFNPLNATGRNMHNSIMLTDNCGIERVKSTLIMLVKIWMRLSGLISVKQIMLVHTVMNLKNVKKSYRIRLKIIVFPGGELMRNCTLLYSWNENEIKCSMIETCVKYNASNTSMSCRQRWIWGPTYYFQ